MDFPLRTVASVPGLGASGIAPLLGEAVSRTTPLVRELDHRRIDGIDVWLLWQERDDLVFVEVADGRTGDRFTLDVARGERALDVFHHPYAYAAVRGIDTRARRLE